MRVEVPVEIILIDVLGLLPMAPRGNHFILVAADNFSKWPEVVSNVQFTYAIPCKTVEICGSKLLTEFISHFECPRWTWTVTKENILKATFLKRYGNYYYWKWPAMSITGLIPQYYYLFYLQVLIKNVRIQNLKQNKARVGPRVQALSLEKR